MAWTSIRAIWYITVRGFVEVVVVVCGQGLSSTGDNADVAPVTALIGQRKRLLQASRVMTKAVQATCGVCPGYTVQSTNGQQQPVDKHGDHHRPEGITGAAQGAL